MGRRIGDSAVQRAQQSARVVELRRAVAFQPQRQSSSLKPSSQPSPAGSMSGTNAGCTGSRAGACQPSVFSPRRTRQIPMPRVGSTSMHIAPLSSSTTCTPSDRPPRQRAQPHVPLYRRRPGLPLILGRVRAHSRLRWRRSEHAFGFAIGAYFLALSLVFFRFRLERFVAEACGTARSSAAQRAPARQERPLLSRFF